MNGSGPHTAVPPWQARADELTAKWQARVRERQQAQMTRFEPVEVALPTGIPVFAIRANIVSLLEAGRIPDAITPYVMVLLKMGQSQDEGAINTHIANTPNDFEQLVNAVWLASVVAPRYTSDLVPEDDSIPVKEVDGRDKIALFNWAQGVEDHLTPFLGPGDAGRERPDSSALQPPPSDLVRRRSVARPTASTEPGEGDVLRGHDRGKPAQADPTRTHRAARTAAQRADVATGSGVDVPAGNRSGRTTGRGKRRGQ